MPRDLKLRHPHILIPLDHKILPSLEQMLHTNQIPSMKNMKTLAGKYDLDWKRIHKWFQVQQMLEIDFKRQRKKLLPDIDHLQRKPKNFDIITKLPVSLEEKYI